MRITACYDQQAAVIAEMRLKIEFLMQTAIGKDNPNNILPFFVYVISSGNKNTKNPYFFQISFLLHDGKKSCQFFGRACSEMSGEVKKDDVASVSVNNNGED